MTHTGFYHSPVEIKDYNATINNTNFFDQPIRNNIKTYQNIRNTAPVQGDDYTTGCLLVLISKKIMS